MLLRTVFQLRIVIPVLILLSVFVFLYDQFQPSPKFNATFIHKGIQEQQYQPHPIDDLIRNANHEHERLLLQEASNLKDAASAYRMRRGRLPPPRFDEWVKFAKENQVLLIEELYDQIYHDLEPFWAIPPRQMRDAIAGWEFVLSVRNGRLTTDRDDRFRMAIWHEMFQQIMHLLPDVDLAFNTMDESRIVVPSEDMDKYMAKAATARHFNQRRESVIQNFTTLNLLEHKNFDHQWISDQNYWKLVREGCHNSTSARHAEPVTDLLSAPEFPQTWPAGSYQGYVMNWTTAKDPCSHPHLRGVHGAFIEPVSISTTHQIFPLLGGCKLPMNNEILIPAERYWEESEMFSGSPENLTTWSSKHNRIIWRGVASGGRHKATTWTHYHRHRFLYMLNGTHVQDGFSGPPTTRILSNATTTPQQIFPLSQSSTLYNVTAASLSPSKLPTWLDTIASDAGFVYMECFPATDSPYCSYTDPYFALADKMPMSEMFDYKYLPDIDGNSYSGRYRAFLRSRSLPLKATIYSEWHDSRLVPWKHFVPLDSTYVDLYGVLDYFVGFDGGGRDAAAERIADEGRVWAEKVLRKEDMLLYVYRLVLEYARVMDERREEMGYVGDWEV